MDYRARRAARLQLANAYIEKISEHGRGFFKHDNRITHFVVCRRTGRLKIIDKYSQRWVDIAKKGRWHGFSDGGTLRNVIECLADFIRGRRNIPEFSYRYWGYTEGEMRALDEALAPIIEASKNNLHQ